MQASWNWLTDYVQVKAAVSEVAGRLTMAGLIVENLTETADDVVLEVEITANRPDWLSHFGIAREIAGLYGLAARVPEVRLPEGAGNVADFAALEVSAPDLCPLYTGRVIKGVKVGPSPSWLKKKIEAVGLRSVNNVVDVTNFVMFECGQPLHAFDLALLGGAKVVVRRAKNGESITLIDGSKLTLKESDLVIADEKRPIALAGVMGGIDSEIGDSTKDVLLESAKFDQYSIRISAKGHGLSSDASYRFERGVDLETVDWASRRAAQLIVETAGGKLAEGVLAVGLQSAPRPVITLRMSHLKRLLGMEVPIEKVRAILASLGFVIRGGSPEDTAVEVPSFRGDVKEEVDLVEEVARIHGYDKIPVETGRKIAAGRETARERMTAAAEGVLTAAGFYGCVCYSITAQGLFKRMSPWTDKAPIGIESRPGHEHSFMRTSLVPSLLSVRKTNEDRKAARPDVYEIAHIYLPSEGEVPDQPLTVAMVAGGDFLTLKGTVERLLETLGAEGARFEPAEFPFLEKGRAARITLDGRMVGYAGTLSQALLGEIDLREGVNVAELDLTTFETLAGKTATMQTLDRFPGVERDLAIVVDEEVLWAEIVAAIEGAKVDTLDSVSFSSIYRGAPIPEGKKSVALHVVFRSRERTLTGGEADEAQARVVAALSAKLGATLR